MIAVIFEAEPSEDGKDAYLETAAGRRRRLGGLDGFISIERFESLARPGRVLSLSFWRDEAAVAAWRDDEEHRRAQAAGRTSLFRDYRIRVARVIRDYGLGERDEAPADSRAAHG